MSTPIFRSWEHRLNQGRLTRGDVLALTSHVINTAYGTAGGKRTNLTQDEAKQILARVQNGALRITPSHTAAGLSFLKRNAGKLGIPAEVVETFQEFRLAGVHVLKASYKVVATPIWEVRSKAGTWLYFYRLDRGTFEETYNAWELKPSPSEERQAAEDFLDEHVRIIHVTDL